MHSHRPCWARNRVRLSTLRRAATAVDAYDDDDSSVPRFSSLRLVRCCSSRS